LLKTTSFLANQIDPKLASHHTVRPPLLKEHINKA